MGIYNLFLIVQKNVMAIGVADKTDDKMILFHRLNKLQTKFVKRYNSKSELESWTGETAIFRDFRMVIRDIFENGQIGEVKAYIPIFKIYKKPFLKLLGQEDQKNLEIKEEDYKKGLEFEKEFLRYTETRLLKQPVAQGFLNSFQYKIAHLIDGFHTVDQIADEMQLPVEEIYKVIKKIDDLGLLEYIELI